jgi:hypothetical protein
MKQALIILFAVIAALSATSVSSDVFCFSPDDWCVTGCDNVEGYSIVGFDSMPAAQAFIASIDTVRIETVRVVTFGHGFHHVIVAYRTAVTESAHTSVTVGVCPPYTVSMTSFTSIDTATIEMNRLPAEQRAKAFVLTVPGVPRDPNTVALLLVERPSPGGVQDSSIGGSR